MKRFTDSMIFRKATAGYQIAKIVGFLFWMPLAIFFFLYLFLR